MTDRGIDHLVKAPTAAEANTRTGAGGPRPRRRPRALPTVLAAAACFAVAFEFLAFQLGAGKDPAMGGTPAGAAAAAQSRPVKRKVVITRIIGSSAPGSTSTSGSTPAAAPAPVSTSSS